MYASYSIGDYGPESLTHCCGIPEIGNWRDDRPAWCGAEEYPTIKNFKKFGCGIFVSTFLPSQEKAMLECEEHHTLLFKTGPHKNKGPDASTEGKEKGVYLCVFKFGKETAK